MSASSSITGLLRSLDLLYEHERPIRRRHNLRIAAPTSAAIRANQLSIGLRLRIRSRGEELLELGGDLAIFAAFREAVAARPQRAKWVRIVLASVWSDIPAAGSPHGSGQQAESVAARSA
jgi:hypothetical protein